jgi:hypothetical protein
MSCLQQLRNTIKRYTVMASSAWSINFPKHPADPAPSALMKLDHFSITAESDHEGAVIGSFGGDPADHDFDTEKPRQ